MASETGIITSAIQCIFGELSEWEDQDYWIIRQHVAINRYKVNIWFIIRLICQANPRTSHITQTNYQVILAGITFLFSHPKHISEMIFLFCLLLMSSGTKVRLDFFSLGLIRINLKEFNLYKLIMKIIFVLWDDSTNNL